MTPSPRTGTSVTAPASPGTLLLSWLVDVCAVALPAIAAWSLWRAPTLGVLLAAETVAVLVVARAATGRTPGSLVTRTVAVAAGTDHAPGLRREMVRAAVLVPLHVTVVGPAITILLGREGRDWSDRLADTASLDLRRRTAAPDLARDDYGRPTVHASAPNGDRWPQARSGTGLPEVGSREVTGQDQDPASSVSPAPGPAASRAPQPTEPGTGIPFPTPAVVSSAPAAPPTVRQRVYLVLDSGERELVDRDLVLGRAPSSQDPAERLVPVPDPTRSLSRTHLRVGLDEEGIWVEDAFSANGTSARMPAGEVLELERGVRRHLPTGTVLTLGERTLTLAVEGASRH